MTSFKTCDADFVDVSEAEARRQVAPWLDRCGLPPDPWPLDRATTAGVLSEGAEYAVTETELDRLTAMGQIPAIQQYDARDLLAVGGALESRRQWWNAPSVHDPKKHASRLALEQAVKAGPEAIGQVLAGLKSFDLPYCLALLAECESRELREKIICIIMALRVGEVLGIESPNLPARVPAGDQFTPGDDEHG